MTTPLTTPLIVFAQRYRYLLLLLIAALIFLVTLQSPSSESTPESRYRMRVRQRQKEEDSSSSNTFINEPSRWSWLQHAYVLHTTILLTTAILLHTRTKCSRSALVGFMYGVVSVSLSVFLYMETLCTHSATSMHDNDDENSDDSETTSTTLLRNPTAATQAFYATLLVALGIVLYIVCQLGVHDTAGTTYETTKKHDDDDDVRTSVIGVAPRRIQVQSALTPDVSPTATVSRVHATCRPPPARIAAASAHAVVALTAALPHKPDTHHFQLLATSPASSSMGTSPNTALKQTTTSATASTLRESVAYITQVLQQDSIQYSTHTGTLSTLEHELDTVQQQIRQLCVYLVDTIRSVDMGHAAQDDVLCTTYLTHLGLLIRTLARHAHGVVQLQQAHTTQLATQLSVLEAHAPSDALHRATAPEPGISQPEIAVLRTRLQQAHAQQQHTVQQLNTASTRIVQLEQQLVSVQENVTTLKRQMEHQQSQQPQSVSVSATTVDTTNSDTTLPFSSVSPTEHRQLQSRLIELESQQARTHALTISREHEIERMSAAHESLRIERDLAQRMYETTQSSTAAQIEQLTRELQDIRAQLLTSQQHATELETQLQHLTDQVTLQNADIARYTNEVDARDTVLLKQVAEREQTLTTERDTLHTQLTQLHTAYTKAQTQLVENLSSHDEWQNIRAQEHIESDAQLAAYKTEIERLTAELHTRNMDNTANHTAQQRVTSQLTALQQQFQHLQSAHTAQTAQLTRAQRSANDAIEQYEQLQRDYTTLRIQSQS